MGSLDLVFILLMILANVRHSFHTAIYRRYAQTLWSRFTFRLFASADDEPYTYHRPVLLDECCEYLSIKPGGVYVDCTLGGGGHTREILQRGGKVIGLDQDRDAIDHTSASLRSYLDSNDLDIIKTNFRNINTAVRSSRLFVDGGVDGVLMDLGISSHQVDERSRGFAFAGDGPLDMRMDKENPSNITAASIINFWNAEEIANVLYEFGDEIRSRQIAREIVMKRPIDTTLQLEQVISRITSWKHRPQTLSRCFQAIRIVVNDEIGALEEVLTTVHQVVKPSGKLVIISYHSLEDRRVKNMLRYGNLDKEVSYFEGISKNSTLPWIPEFKRALLPSDEELSVNRRSRSAKLRVATRNGPGVLETIAAATSRKSKLFPRLGTKELAKLERNLDDVF